MTTPVFQGVWTAVVTPFQPDGSLDLDGYRAVLDDQIAQGVDGIVSCGTTGEASTLSDDEYLSVVRTAVEHCKGKVPVIAGAGSNNTQAACDKQKAMKELGVDGTLQVTPWYNKPSQEGLYQHFSAVVKAASVPTMLYNVPGRTSIDLLPETTARLARDHSDIVSVKEATGSIQRAEHTCALIDRADFSVLSGDDGLILGLLAVGGHGVVSVISHLCASDLKAMINAFHAGDRQTAAKLSHKVRPLTPAMFFRPNPVPVKAALALTRLKGKMHDTVRLPLVALDDKDRTTLKDALAAAGYGT